MQLMVRFPKDKDEMLKKRMGELKKKQMTFEH